MRLKSFLELVLLTSGKCPYVWWERIAQVLTVYKNDIINRSMVTFKRKTNMKIPFPIGANEYESSIKWECLGEISDKDFGFVDIVTKEDIIRFCVRVLLLNANGELCVIESEKYGYIQLPGGRIEQGESIEAALRRETREEAGYEIREIEPLGYIYERRESVQNIHPWSKSISFIYTAKTYREVGTNYTDEKIQEGFRPVFLDPEEAIKRFHNQTKNIDNYSGYFANRRDLTIIEKYKFGALL